MFKKHIVIGLLCITSQLPLHADITDFLRPEEKREDYTKDAQQSGFLHETYTDKSGNVHRRFAPVESIFGFHRGAHQVTDNTKNNATDYKKTTRSGKRAPKKTYEDVDTIKE